MAIRLLLAVALGRSLFGVDIDAIPDAARDPIAAAIDAADDGGQHVTGFLVYPDFQPAQLTIKAVEATVTTDSQPREATATTSELGFFSSRRPSRRVRVAAIGSTVIPNHHSVSESTQGNMALSRRYEAVHVKPGSSESGGIGQDSAMTRRVALCR